MPIVTHHPTGVGATSEWTGIGADVVSAVASNDGDTSYIRESFGLKTQLYVMPDLPADAATINSCSENAVARKFQNVGDNTIELYLNGSYSGGSNTPLTYTLFTGAWAPANPGVVNAAQSGVRGFDTAGGENRVTELYRVVDYNVGGEVIVLLFNALLPLVGAGLTVAQLSLFNDQQRIRTGHYLRADELPQAHREWVDNRRPAFFFLKGGTA
jgi:hypothetical protein